MGRLGRVAAFRVLVILALAIRQRLPACLAVAHAHLPANIGTESPLLSLGRGRHARYRNTAHPATSAARMRAVATARDMTRPGGRETGEKGLSSRLYPIAAPPAGTAGLSLSSASGSHPSMPAAAATSAGPGRCAATRSGCGTTSSKANGSVTRKAYAASRLGRPLL